MNSRLARVLFFSFVPCFAWYAFCDAYGVPEFLSEVLGMVFAFCIGYFIIANILDEPPPPPKVKPLRFIGAMQRLENNAREWARPAMLRDKGWFMAWNFEHRQIVVETTMKCRPWFHPARWAWEAVIVLLMLFGRWELVPAPAITTAPGWTPPEVIVASTEGDIP